MTDRDELLGHADSMDQQANWIEGALAPETPDSQRIGIEDIDIDELRGASDLLRRLASSDSEVKVRELEWQERVGVDCTFDANTSIGHYIATITDDGRGMWFIVGQTTSIYTIGDIDVVRAAAQADYEARIRSALVEAPAVKGEPEPVAWQFRYRLSGEWRDLGNIGIDAYRSAMRDELNSGDIVLRPLYTAPPADAGMREALAEIKLIALTAGAPGGLATHSALSRIVRLCRDAGITETMTEIRTALTAPGATTKSDGGDQPPHVGLDWKLSDDAKARLAEIDAVIIRPGDPRLNQIIGGPSDPSSTRSEVTASVAELARFINGYTGNDENGNRCARALLDQFEIRRK